MLKILFFSQRFFLLTILPVLFIFFLFQENALFARKTDPSSITETNADTKEKKKSLSKKKYHFDFIPILVFDTDPNEGQTYGIQPSFLIKDKNDDVKMVIAPTISYNSYVKVGGNLFVLMNPTEDSEINFVVGAGQKVYREAKLTYENKRAFHDRFFIEGGINYLRDPFGHFFGLGKNSPLSQESVYVGETFSVYAGVGVYLFPHFRLSLKEEFSKVDLKPGIIKKLPSTINAFSNSDGVVDSLNLKHRFSAIYDDRPNGNVSTKGNYGEIYFLLSSQQTGSDYNFHGFGLDVRKTLSFRNERFTTVFAGFMQKLYGQNIPFYEQSSLGGADRLRGFGKDRFIDQGRILLSIEERIRIKKLRLFNTDILLSLDPFFEVGEVFHNFPDISFKKLQPVGGAGFRVRVPPNMIGRLDVGVGKEGPSVFVELDYPF